MKKNLIISLGIFTCIVSSSLKTFASENIAIKYDSNEKFYEQKVLNNEFLDYLIIDDFCYIYNLLINEENMLTEEELNEKSIEILTNIAQERIDNLKGILPDEYYHLNKDEKKLIAKHPWAAVKIFYSSKKASNEAKDLFISSSLHNGNGDAFRHAFWNILMTLKVGETLAKDFADAHEYGDEYADPLEVKMDLSNNATGRQIAKYSNIDDEYKLRNILITDYLDRGRLVRIVDNRLVETDSTGKREVN